MNDGKITEGDKDIYVADEFGFSGEESGSTVLYMPADRTYTVVNNDRDITTFEATMVNVDRSAGVSTEADCITFTVSDSEKVNSVCVDAEKNEEYSIVLDYSEDLENESVEISGKGCGETVNVVQEGQTLILDNCDGAEVNVGG